MKNAFIWFMGIVALLAFIGGCFSEDTEPVKEEPKQEAKAVEPKKEEKPEKEAPEVTEKPEVKDESIDPQVALKILKDSYKNTAHVEFDKETDTFIILPTEDGIVLELAMIMNGEISMDVWNELVTSFTGVSKSLGSKYLLVMLNPANPDNYILMAGNGVVLYDAITEEGGEGL